MMAVRLCFEQFLDPHGDDGADEVDELPHHRPDIGPRRKRQGQRRQVCPRKRHDAG